MDMSLQDFIIISLSSEIDLGKCDNIPESSASTIVSLFSLNNNCFFLIIQKIKARRFHVGRNLRIIEHPCKECVKISNTSINNKKLNFFRLNYFLKQNSAGTVIISSYLHITISKVRSVASTVSAMLSLFFLNSTKIIEQLYSEFMLLEILARCFTKVILILESCFKVNQTD